MDTKRKKVLVVGTGLSGISAAELLVEKGVDILLYDSNEKLCASDIRKKSERLKDVPMLFGNLDEADASQFSIALLSPGVAPKCFRRMA